MKILLCHNFYQQRGGEDLIFETEANLLERQGHKVIRYTCHNDSVRQKSSLMLAGTTIWNQQVYRELRTVLRRERPHVAHFHNIFPLISPAAYYAAKAESVPVVQNIQNYRLLCPNALFLRNGNVCEKCINRLFPWPGVAYACYRKSRPATAVVAAMLAVHKLARTWHQAVDVFIAATVFARDKLIEGGLPAEKITIKPNLIDPDPGVGDGTGNFALYVGRLSPEKGIDTLLGAWQQIPPELHLAIVGDGPLRSQVADASEHAPNIQWYGNLPNQQVLDLMKQAYSLIFPSTWYEGLPLVIAEACATGLPVICSNLGAMSSLIHHRFTGLHFIPGDADDLAAQVRWAFAHPIEFTQIRQQARAEFEKNYSADRNYQRLLEIYQRLLDQDSNFRTKTL